MKLTPEQKAFFEYGKAIEKMNSSKKRLRGIWRSSENIIRRIGKASIIEPRHKENIKAAWQKRAICRAFMIPEYERICENCNHLGMGVRFSPCSKCHRNPFTEINDEYQDNWEPRKEGE